MKKIITITTLLLLVSAINTINAQIRFNAGIQIAAPICNPSVMNDDEDNQYYYYPDYDMYFNLATQQYIYAYNGNWVFSATIPYRFRGEDFNHARRMYMNEARPYMRRNWYRDRNENNYYNDNYNRYNNFENRRWQHQRFNNNERSEGDRRYNWQGENNRDDD